MKDLDAIMSRVLERVPNAPEPLVERHILDAAIEFARRTRIWRESEAITADTEGTEYLAVGCDAQIYEITHAAFNGAALEPVTMDWLDDHRQGWRDESGPPFWVTQSAPDTVRIVPKPDETGQLQIEMILLPSETATRLPDKLVDTYARVIADGAIGSVLLLPADWGDRRQGAFHSARFEQGLDRWGDRVPRGQQRAKRRSRPASYF